jgi:hypothetical protein
MMDESMLRRESDRTLGAILAKLEIMEKDMAQMKDELQQIRDTKNQGLGMLLFVGATVPMLGAVVWWLAQRAFKL